MSRLDMFYQHTASDQWLSPCCQAVPKKPLTRRVFSNEVMITVTLLTATTVKEWILHVYSPDSGLHLPTDRLFLAAG